MNARQLGMLSAIALAVVVLSVWISIANKPGSSTENAALLPALKGHLADIKTVNIFHGGDQPAVSMAGSDGTWTVSQRNNYAADSGKIKGLLLALESAKLREEKTSNPDNYATLGVQDAGTRLSLQGLSAPIDLIVGKSDAGGHGNYVRLKGDAKSWLINEQLDVPTDASGWLHRDIVSIGADRIQEAKVEVGSEPHYSVFKEKRSDMNFDVKPLPKGRELNTVSAPNGIAQTLVNLQLDDVRPIIELSSAKSAAQTTIQTFDGLSINVKGFEVDGKHWITIHAAFDEATAKRFREPAKSEAPKSADAAKSADASTTAAPPEDPDKKVRTEAESIDKQVSDWAYAIAQYKYDAIFKPVDQLLRKK